jgi:hypothetical protein
MRKIELLVSLDAEIWFFQDYSKITRFNMKLYIWHNYFSRKKHFHLETNNLIVLGADISINQISWNLKTMKTIFAFNAKANVHARLAMKILCSTMCACSNLVSLKIILLSKMYSCISTSNFQTNHNPKISFNNLCNQTC